MTPLANPSGCLLVGGRRTTRCAACGESHMGPAYVKPEHTIFHKDPMPTFVASVICVAIMGVAVFVAVAG